MSKFGQMVVLTSGARGVHHYPHLIHILWHKAVLVRWSRYCCVKMFQVERKDGVEVRMILAAIVVVVEVHLEVGPPYAGQDPALVHWYTLSPSALCCRIGSACTAR